MGEGGGLPQVWAVVSHVSLELPVACPSTKGALESELTNLLVGLMQVRVTLLEILSFVTCLMQLKNVACNSKIVACEIF